MNRPRRVVRKLPDHPAAPTLDEQLWPVQFAIIVLAGLLAGIVLSVCSFDDPRWYRHPLTWLTANAAFIGLLMWVTAHVHPQVMRRAVMLSLVVSLIVNAALLIGMAWARIFTAPWLDQQQLTTAEALKRQVIVPEYTLAPLPHHNPAQRDFERPVETGSVAAENVAVARQEISDVPQDDTTQTTHIEDESQRQQTHLHRQRRAVVTPPRRGENLSLLSRRAVIRTGKPGSHRARQVPAPSPPRQADTLQARDTPLAHHEARLPEHRSNDSSRSSVRSDRPIPAALTRRAQGDQPELTADVPRYLRRINRAQRVPHTDLRVVSEPTTQARQTDILDAQPRNSELTRSTAAAAERVRRPDRPRDSAPVARPLDHTPSRAANQASDLASSVRAMLEQNRPERLAKRSRTAAELATSSSAVSRPAAATSDAVGNIRGSESLAEATVSAVTTLVRTRTNAEQANLTAAKGDTQIDLGPHRLVDKQRPGRASGGSQPELNLRAQSRLAVRSRDGGVKRISLQSDIAVEVAAPAANSSQQSPWLEAQPSASPLVRKTQGAAAADSLGAASDPTVGMLAIAAIEVTAPSQANRAESIDAPQAISKPSDGVERRKVAASPVLATNTVARTVDVARPNQSAGLENAPAVTATNVEIARSSAGELELPSGLAVDEVAARGITNSLGSTADIPLAARRSASAAVEIAIGLVEDNYVLTKSPRTSRSARPTTATVAPDVGGMIAGFGAPVETTSLDSLAGGDSAKLNRPGPGAMVFERDEDVGPGGVTQTLAAVVGFPTPRAQTRSELLQIEDARFVRRNIGGPPVASSRAAVAVDAFQHRLKRRGVDQPIGGRPAPPRTEEAIELGLVYLLRHQQADGRWRLNNTVSAGTPDLTPTLSSDTAATGLSLLAFLGAGYHHLDENYQGSVRAALAYLIENQADNGNLYVQDDKLSGASVALYSHGIAALSLCEAYGMTQDPWLREPAQKALDYVAATQHPNLGGWRYVPGVESDTSVSGWMLMALKSGELADLDVAPEVYQRAKQWLDRAQAADSERHLYRYNPFAPDTDTQRHGRQPTHVMTSVGLLMRMYLGWRRDNPWMQRGADYLAANPPLAGTSGSARRDTYYWYYATQVMFHMGGEQWEAWNSRLHPLLVDAQIQDGELAGSWNPYMPVPDRWAVHAGRLYVTTMNLLSLEVYYRHLPIYADTGR